MTFTYSGAYDKGLLDKVRTLIEARINSKDEKYTRYIGAYYNVHLYVVYKMSKAGANIYLNETSFIAACYKRHINIVE